MATWTSCACPDCLIYRRRMSKLARVGRAPRPPRAQAWAVLDDLIRRGWTGAAIASAAGISASTIDSLLARYRRDGYQLRLSNHHARAIINHGPPTEGQVGAYAATRRLQALSRIGYALDDLAHATGVNYTTTAAIRSGYTTRLSVDRDRAIADAYERLCMTPGPSQPAVLHATRHGWHSPLAWDDIDNPDEQPKVGMLNRGDPDPIAVARLIAGERFDAARQDQIAACAELTRRGMSAADIADQLGLAQRTVVRWRARARTVAA